MLSPQWDDIALMSGRSVDASSHRPLEPYRSTPLTSGSHRRSHRGHPEPRRGQEPPPVAGRGPGVCAQVWAVLAVDRCGMESSFRPDCAAGSMSWGIVVPTSPPACARDSDYGPRGIGVPCAWRARRSANRSEWVARGSTTVDRSWTVRERWLQAFAHSLFPPRRVPPLGSLLES